jgi:hypothetical protein
MRLLLALLALAALASAPPASAAPEPACAPTNGGDMDHYSEACVDLSDLDCPVYHERPSGRTCVPP